MGTSQHLAGWSVRYAFWPRLLHSVGLVIPILVAVGTAACGGDVTADGQVGGRCYPNSTCNPGLSCTGGFCVADSGNIDTTQGENEGGEEQIDCDNTSKDFACAPVANCGGDPTGEWNLELCDGPPGPAFERGSSVTTFNPQLPQAKYTQVGSLSIRNSGTYSLHYELSGSVTIPSPDASSCSDVPSRYTLISPDILTYDSIRCDIDPTLGHCVCVLTIEPTSVDESGSWSVIDSTIRLGAKSYQFCARGGTLTFENSRIPPRDSIILRGFVRSDCR